MAKRKSQYARGSKLVKSRTTTTRYGNKVTDIKKGSMYDESDKRFTMRPVNSSNVKEVGYKRDDNTLRVKFKSGASYDYFHVPEKLHRQMMGSQSKGKFLNENIKKNYVYAKV